MKLNSNMSIEEGIKDLICKLGLIGIPSVMVISVPDYNSLIQLYGSRIQYVTYVDDSSEEGYEAILVRAAGESVSVVASRKVKKGTAVTFEDISKKVKPDALTWFSGHKDLVKIGE